MAFLFVIFGHYYTLQGHFGLLLFCRVIRIDTIKRNTTILHLFKFFKWIIT